MELTELIKDYIATELLSSIELDFLEGELWETIQHISEINTLTMAPKDICCLLYTSPSPRDGLLSRMPSSA